VHAPTRTYRKRFPKKPSEQGATSGPRKIPGLGWHVRKFAIGLCFSSYLPLHEAALSYRVYCVGYGDKRGGITSGSANQILRFLK
jgi:hypothetical protein